MTYRGYIMGGGVHPQTFHNKSLVLKTKPTGVTFHNNLWHQGHSSRIPTEWSLKKLHWRSMLPQPCRVWVTAWWQQWRRHTRSTGHYQGRISNSMWCDWSWGTPDFHRHSSHTSRVSGRDRPGRGGVTCNTSSHTGENSPWASGKWKTTGSVL